MSATEANQSPAAQQIQMIAFGDFFFYIAFGDFELHVCFTHSCLSPRGEQSADGLSEKSRPPNCALPLLASAVCAAQSAPQAESLELWGLCSAGRLSPPPDEEAGSRELLTEASGLCVCCCVQGCHSVHRVLAGLVTPVILGTCS